MSEGQMNLFGEPEKPKPAEPQPRKKREQAEWALEGDVVDGFCHACHSHFCPHAQEWLYGIQTSIPFEEPASSDVERVARSIFDAFPVEPYPTGHVGPPDGLSIEEAFWRFHNANPQVYRELVMLARRARSRRVHKLGIGMMFEVLRWRHALRTGGDEFKLNNNYRSYYSRLIMLREADLADIFETRRLHAP